jgi:RNA polymerase sigma-70 factor (ECF subfamily)
LTPKEKLSRFEAEISPHLGPAYNLARWLTRNHEDAEDVVQEAFLRAFSAFESFRGIDPRPWLLAIVRNTSMTFMSRKRGAAQSPDFEDIAKTASSSDPNPETLMLESCSHEQIHEALAKLPPEFREALVLRELEELSYKEIATVTGVPMGTVMSRISRAREGLRGLLTSHGKGAGSR